MCLKILKDNLVKYLIYDRLVSIVRKSKNCNFIRKKKWLMKCASLKSLTKKFVTRILSLLQMTKKNWLFEIMKRSGKDRRRKGRKKNSLISVTSLLSVDRDASDSHLTAASLPRWSVPFLLWSENSFLFYFNFLI